MRSFSCLLAVWGTVFATPAPGMAQTLIVALGGGEHASERVAARRADEEKNGRVIVATDEAITRLTGAAPGPATAALDGNAAALLDRDNRRAGRNDANIQWPAVSRAVL